MFYIEKYNKDKKYYFPDGKVANYERIKNLYNAIDEMPFVAFTDYTGKIITSLQMLDLLRTQHEIDTSLNEDEAVETLRDKLNNSVSEANSDERIADALEDLVMLNMPDSIE